MLTIFAIFKTDIVQSTELLEITLVASYKDKNYELFDDLFNIYIESTSPESLNAEMFNLALKVYLKMNPGLAKQFLYQMFQSDYPINEHTLFHYLKVADKESNFQSIQFVVSMLERYPLTPINDEAYGELYASYLRNHTGHEIGVVLNFLTKRQVLEIESVKVAKFLSEVDNDSLDMFEIWSRLKVFKLQHSLSLNNLKKIYHSIYKRNYKMMKLVDVNDYIQLMREDGIPITESSVQQQIIYHITDESTLVSYLKGIKAEGFKLDQFIIKSIWTRFIMNNPDNGVLITDEFFQLAKDQEGKTSWIDTIPRLLIHKSRASKEINSLVGNRYDYDTSWVLEEIKHNVKSKKDYKIIETLTDSIRRDSKPSLQVLNAMLKGLINLNSPHVDDVYRIIHELHSQPSVDVEITYLTREISQISNKIKEKSCITSKPKREAIINDFAEKYRHRLSYLHYIQLASHLIDLQCYNTALIYLRTAKAMIPESQKSYESSIYVMTLKVLSRVYDMDAFISILRHIDAHSTIRVNRFMLLRAKQYQTAMCSAKPDTEEKQLFLEEFNEIFKRLKKRLGERRNEMMRNLKDVTALLAEWIEEESMREAK
jgi:hypothetical protein